MTNEEFDLLEVRPQKNGWFLITLHNFNPREGEQLYYRDWVQYNESGWNYGKMKGRVLCCFIHEVKPLKI